MDIKNVKGIVTMTFTDETTGAVRVVETTNRAHRIVGAVLFGSARPNKISLLWHQTNKDTRLTRTQYPKIVADTAIADTYNLSSTEGPWWIELKQRFQSTGADRQINGVLIWYYLYTMRDYEDSYGVVTLETPVVQGSNEALDITYRMVFEDVGMSMRLKNTFKSRLPFGLITTSDKYSKKILVINGCIRTPQLEDWGQLGAQRNIYLSSIIGSGTGYGYVNWSISKLDHTQYNFRELATSPRVSNASYNDRPDETDADVVGAIGEGTQILNTLQKYTGYPVGPLYSHSSNSKTWMEDLDNLAEGRGYPLMRKTDDTYMSEIAACDTHVITITKSGNVGTARYYHSVLRTDGRLDSKFGKGWLIPVPERTLPLYDTGLEPHVKQTDPNGPQPQFAPIAQTGVYNTRTVYSVDYTDRLGFSLHDLITHAYHYFDEFTSPGLPVGMPSITIHQIARDTAGSIYMAAGSLGLVKITTPLTVPLISIISKATMGITGDISAIGHGGNDAIFIHSSDGLSYTTTGGSSWTNKGAWTLTGDTSKPSVVITHPTMSITANPNDFNEIAFTFINGAESYGVWYDITTNTVYAPTYANWHLSNSDGVSLECDPIHGVWMFNSDGYSNRQIGYTKYGATSINNTTSTLDTTATLCRMNTVWLYDHQDNPYLMRRVDSATDNKCTAFLPNGLTQGNFYLLGTYQVCMNRGLHYDAGDGISREAGGINTVLCKSKDAVGRGAELVSLAVSNSLSATYQSTDVMFDSASFPIDEPGLFRELGAAIRTHRWDQANALWKDARSWSLPSVATADGSSSAGALRKHFSVGSQRFNGRAYLDISPAFNTGSYANGLTLLTTCTIEAKTPNALTATPNHRYPTGEGYAHTLMSIHVENTSRGIVIQERNNNGFLTVMDYTVPSAPVVTELVSSGTEGTTRMAVLVSGDGTTVSVFVDGVQIGNNVSLSSALPMTGAEGQLSVVLGARQFAYEIDRQYNYEFLKGTLTNVQLWSRMMPPVELVSDNNDRGGLIVGSGLIARYLMSGDLLEDKATTLTENTAPYGCIHSFQEGDLSADSYLAGEAYNAVVSRDSMVAGNAVSMAGAYTVNLSTTVVDTVTSPQTGTNVISTINAEIRELAHWAEDDPMVTCVGECICKTSGTDFVSEQSSVDDISIEFELVYPYDTQPTSVTIYQANGTTYNKIMSVNFSATSDISVSYRTQTLEYIPYSHTTGKKYKMEYIRATGLATLYADVGSGWVAISTPVTETLANSEMLFIKCSYSSNTWDPYDSNLNGGVVNTYITYTTNGNIMRMGDKTTGTGWYARGTQPLLSTSLATVRIFVDGEYRSNIRLVHNRDSRDTLMYHTPVEGSVILSESGGNLLFHDSDIGKTVTMEPLGIRTPS